MQSVSGKLTIAVSYLALFGCSSHIANATDVKFIPLNSTDGTEAVHVTAETKHFKGRDGLQVKVASDHNSSERGGCDNCTFLLVDHEPFKNGVIEIDLAGMPSKGTPSQSRGFVGVVFRVNDEKSEYEGFYLRPMNALDKGPRRKFTAQYFSIPGYPWHRLRKEFPNRYEAYADVEPGEWFRLRIEVADSSANFFINGQHVLGVDNMFQGADLQGGIGLFTEPWTDAYFSNLSVTRK